jgi:quercetin dioxygenase-like cupin family protein
MRYPILVLPFALAGGLCLGGSGAQEVPPLSESTTLEGLQAAPQAVPIPEGWKVFYDKDDIEMVEIRRGMRRGVVAGKTISVSVDELDPEYIKGSPPSSAHHHAHEQADLGLEGAMEVYVDGMREPVGPMQISLIPPDAAHTVTRVMGPGKVLSLELSTIRREDLLPHRPQITFPASPEPKPVPPGHGVFADFNKMPWRGEPGTRRVKAVFGQNMTVFMWHIPASTMEGTHLPGHHHTVEQISILLEGHVEIRVGDQIRRVGPGDILCIPADVDHPGMKAVDGEDIVIVDFQPIVRQDLMERMEGSPAP